MWSHIALYDLGQSTIDVFQDNSRDQAPHCINSQSRPGAKES